MHEILTQGFHIKTSEGEPVDSPGWSRKASFYLGDIFPAGYCCYYTPQVGLFSYTSVHMIYSRDWFLFQLKNQKKKKSSENLDHHGTHILQNKHSKWYQSHPRVFPFLGSCWVISNGITLIHTLNKIVWKWLDPLGLNPRENRSGGLFLVSSLSFSTFVHPSATSGKVALRNFSNNKIKSVYMKTEIHIGFGGEYIKYCFS